jgi:SAM-dependent methyltransferase
MQGRPRPFIPGLVPTLNHRGFMSEWLDPFSARFAQHAALCRAPVLDMGCAYGIATRAALEAGATVHACDMDARHVAILAAETPPGLRARLTTSVGTLPDVDFAADAFDAILCSRVLHFLTGAEIRATLAKMRHWLRPGGRLFLVADTPYSGFWSAGASAYEQRKAAGEEWPGFIADIGAFMKDGRVPEGMLAWLNPLDPDLLARECARAGLVVEEAAFTGRAGDAAGRHHAGAVAIRTD